MQQIRLFRSIHENETGDGFLAETPERTDIFYANRFLYVRCIIKYFF